MGDLGRIDVEKCILYSHDLVEVLKNKKDANHLIQSLEGAKTLQSYCEADFSEVQNLLQDYQKKIDACKQRVDEANGEAVGDKDLVSLENELDEELQKEHSLMEELRIVNDQISDLECQIVIVEDQRKILSKCEKDGLRDQMNLSLYASVTNVVPNMYDQPKISGHIVEKARDMVEKFEFDPADTASFEICNSLWKMIDSEGKTTPSNF